MSFFVLKYAMGSINRSINTQELDSEITPLDACNCLLSRYFIAALLNYENYF